MAAARSFRTRALIIADSLALPRADVGYDQTWPALLAASMPEVIWINRAARQSTTERLNNEGDEGADCLEFYRPDLVILQLGICDCAPRVLHRRTAAIVYRLPFGLSARLPAWLEHWSGRKIANCFVPLVAYEQNLRAYLSRAATCGTSVIAIAILPASQLFSSKNPHVVSQISAYNEALDRLTMEFDDFQILHPFDCIASIGELFVDGYHLSEHGARRVAAELEPLVRQALSAHAVA